MMSHASLGIIAHVLSNYQEDNGSTGADAFYFY